MVLAHPHPASRPTYTHLVLAQDLHHLLPHKAVGHRRERKVAHEAEAVDRAAGVHRHGAHKRDHLHAVRQLDAHGRGGGQEGLHLDGHVRGARPLPQRRRAVVDLERAAQRKGALWLHVQVQQARLGRVAERVHVVDVRGIQGVLEQVAVAAVKLHLGVDGAPRGRSQLGDEGDGRALVRRQRPAWRPGCVVGQVRRTSRSPHLRAAGDPLRRACAPHLGPKKSHTKPPFSSTG